MAKVIENLEENGLTSQEEIHDEQRTRFSESTVLRRKHRKRDCHEQLRLRSMYRLRRITTISPSAGFSSLELDSLHNDDSEE